jgi:hypothetical protein
LLPFRYGTLYRNFYHRYPGNSIDRAKNEAETRQNKSAAFAFKMMFCTYAENTLGTARCQQHLLLQPPLQGLYKTQAIAATL